MGATPEHPRFSENVMSANPEQNKYELIFTAFTTGDATVTGVNGAKKMKKLSFNKACNIKIGTAGPDEGRSSVKSLTITFKALDGAPPSPIGDGKESSYTWEAKNGGKPMPVGRIDGRWDFGAVLTGEDGTQYTLPDPEFQVGDGIE
jgi:hypothetical protein